MNETKTDHAETEMPRGRILSMEDLKKIQEAAEKETKTSKITDLLISAVLSMTLIAYMFHELTNVVLGVNAPWYADMLVGFLLPLRVYQIAVPLMILRYLGLLVVPLVRMG